MSEGDVFHEKVMTMIQRLTNEESSTEIYTQINGLIVQFLHERCGSVKLENENAYVDTIAENVVKIFEHATELKENIEHLETYIQNVPLTHKSHYSARTSQIQMSEAPLTNDQRYQLSNYTNFILNWMVEEAEKLPSDLGFVSRLKTWFANVEDLFMKLIVDKPPPKQYQIHELFDVHFAQQYVIDLMNTIYAANEIPTSWYIENTKFKIGQRPSDRNRNSNRPSNSNSNSNSNSSASANSSANVDWMQESEYLDSFDSMHQFDQQQFNMNQQDQEQQQQSEHSESKSPRSSEFDLI
jgi:hypothetical protein